MAKELSHRDITFLDLLFSGKHPEEAKQLAGYPKDYPIIKIAEQLNEELIKKSDTYLSLYSTQGVIELVKMLNEPETPGTKSKLAVIIELLDRGGVVKKEKKEVAQVSQSFMFVVPPKLEIKEE